MADPDDSFPPDVRRALSLAAAWLGLSNIAALAVCFVLALMEKPIPAIIGFVIGKTMDNLGDMGRWVLDYHAKRRGRASGKG